MSVNTALNLISVRTVETILLRDLNSLAGAIQQKGLQCRATSPKALLSLTLMSEERVHRISLQVKSLLKIVFTMPGEDVSNDEHPERAWVEQALAMYDLELRDNYWNELKRDDVIEVYNSDHIQLFRTFNFFKISSYSLLDLLTNEWFELWKRPSFVLDSLIKAAEDLMSGKITKTTQINAPRHILKEIYDDSSIDFKCSSVLVHPGFVSPLYRKGSRDIAGFLCSLRGEIMGYDDDANKIAMI